jgi:hypothetical protein
MLSNIYAARLLLLLLLLLSSCAGGKAAIDSNEGVRAKLANIMSYHVVRPVDGYEAFTTPFMSEGVQLQVRAHRQTVLPTVTPGAFRAIQ